MVSPTNPSQAYSAVPNPRNSTSSPTQANFPSPDPNSNNDDVYSSLGGHHIRDSALLSPPTPDPDTQNLLGSMSQEYMPAPSIMTRDSTYSSLPGTPPLRGDNRKSWGSGVGLAAAAEGISGAPEPRRPTSVARAPSGLAHSSLGWNNANNDRLSVSDEDDEQGHITPAVAGIGAAEVQSEKPRWAEVGDNTAPKRKNKKWLWAGLCLGLLALIALAVGLGIGLTRKSTKNGSSSSTAQDGTTGASTTSQAKGSKTTASSGAPSATATSGTTGTLITLDDGSTMTYTNPYGGEWHWDEANPFNSSSRPNSWSPRLNEAWDWASNRVYGVNVGGWLVTEPFIVPSLYEKYATVNNQTAIDEFTLSQNMGSDLESVMTDHYDTFITENDFIEMAAAGINWVRIPIGFWAIETWDGEPYLERVSWSYLLKAIKWCRKYGIRINLDLHAVPGSQNGWNHSGRQTGAPNWLEGPMGLANAQRSLDYIRTLAQFIAQPQYSDVIQLFGFINEPNGNAIGKGPIASFYLQAHQIIRDITGIGAGNGPYLSMHDGFLGVTSWYDFAPGMDRVVLDQHNYMVFQDQPTGDLDQLKIKPCQWWAKSTNTSFQQWGPIAAGEWSAAWNDCGQWVNNVGTGSRYDGSYTGYSGKATGSCDYWNDYTQWNQSTIEALNHFVLGSMDAFQDYFFWTWTIGNSTGSVKQPNPFWNYKLGLQQGWVPQDPRTAVGTCLGDGVAADPFDGTFSNPAVTGGTGAGTIAASDSSSYPWPPTSFTNIAAGDMEAIYQYTQTADPITMPAATFTSPGSTATIDAGNGWANPSADNRKAYAAISGCSYAPEYSAASLGVPADACGAGLTQPTKRAEIPIIKKAAYPQPTNPPSRR
ncbi:uncharacterized protein IL334_003526 [Kwoniella shivajii]|uniref:glucan 1,3-beta-glucosidase n=1 Tax=Kwoniella shivajii TaxID=564305 RepID=A0ABZ1D1W4_9TREE|nr:hypothetical protein IL334_003526 [Kwoniella shivajii]